MTTPTADTTLRYRRMKRTLSELAFCFLVALLLLAVCTRSSFLYAFNNWDDTNSYFTVGKSMMRGMTPYKDLFDQKGVLLYFLYGLASLLSFRGFGGVFLMELIAGTLHLFACYKILLLYVRRPYAFVALPFLGAAVYASRAMWWGGSAEEFLLPFLSAGLYLGMSYFKKKYPEPVPYRTMLLAGVLAGCVFLIKFNSLGFYIGFVLMMLYADLFGNRAVIGGLRRWQLTFYALLYFMLGFLLPVVPFTVYFFARHAIYDWYDVYIYCNLFVYSNPMTISERFVRVAKVLYAHMGHNPLYFALMISGGIYWLCRTKRRIAEKMFVLLTGICLTLVIFIGGVDLPYYPLPMSVYSVLGVLFVTELVQGAFDRYRNKVLRREEKEPKALQRGLTLAGGVLSLLSSALICTTSLNIPYLSVKREDVWQYQYADIIEASGISNPTLLNVRCFDAGLYTTAGILPTCRFFQTQTIHLDEVWETQYRFIREGATDFVLSRDEEEPDGIKTHYRLIMAVEQRLKDFEHVYYLYEKTE